MKRKLTALLLALGAIISGQQAMADGFDVMQKKFTETPKEQPLAVYWYWLDGNISEEGVVKDLHAMKNQSEKLPVRTNKFLVIGNRLIPANKKSVAAIEGVDKKAFADFLKAEKIKWNEVQDLVKVVDFLSAK